MTKIESIGLAALTAAWVVYGTHWAGELLVHPDTEVADSLRIEVAEKEDSTAAEAPAEEAAPLEAPADLALMLASADLDDGGKVFKKCAACHDASDGGPNKVGPNLWGIVGREKASHEGFAYSETLSGLGGAWTPEDLYLFVHNPKAFAPGTKMAFKGIDKDSDLASLIAYLNSQSSSPVTFGQ